MAKILIVDDEPHIRLLLEQTLEELEDHGAEILSADNGESALEVIMREKPGLVFLDVMMPKMDGFEVCHRIKNQSPAVDSVYIVLLTAKGQEFDKKKGMESGADMYMTKPFNPDDIVAKAIEVLGITL